MWLLKPLLLSHVIVFLYLLMKAEGGVQRKEFSLQHAFPLYSFGYHRNDLAGEGKVFPALCLQVCLAFPSLLSTWVLHLTLG